MRHPFLNTCADYGKTVVTGLCRSPISVMAAVLLVIWWPAASHVDALPAIAQVVHQATMGFGVLWVVWTAVSQATWVASEAVSASSPWKFALDLLERSVVLSALLVAECRFGNEIAQTIEAARTHPSEAMAIVGSAVALLFASRVMPRREVAFVRHAESASAMGYATMLPSVPQPRSAKEVYRTAVHEAGHLLLYAVRSGGLPEGLRASVPKSIASTDLYRGHVTHSGTAVEVPTEGSIRWAMLMSLAGTEAEAVVFGERADGAVLDCRLWLGQATHYLACGFGEVFYDEAVSESQREHNRAVLNSLKKACGSELQGFLAANRDVLDELVDALVERETMEIEALRPFLDRVRAVPELGVCASGV